MNNSEDFKFIKGFGGGGGGNTPPAPTPAYEDTEGFIYGNDVYSVYQFSKIKDLLSEGPIEGLVEGEYQYKGRVGDLGYTGVIYNEYPLAIGSQSQVKFLRSIQWNESPLVDSQNKFNFQQININYSKGTARGITNADEIDSISYIRGIGERLRGPNISAISAADLIDFQKNYRITNKECKKINIGFKIGSLYRTLKFQDINNFKEDNEVISVNQNNNTFLLKKEGRFDGEGKPAVEDVTAGVGSVIRYQFDIRIKMSPVYKDGFSSRVPNDLSILTESPISVVNSENLLLTPENLSSVYKLSFRGKITQGYVKQVIIDFSKIFNGLVNDDSWLGWDITILKETPEETNTSKSSFISVESITERYSSSFRYPNASVVSSSFNAEYFSRIPERSYDVNLLKVKVPSNYDPITRTYGEGDTLTINTQTEINSSSNSSSQSIISANKSEGYSNVSDSTPPITNGLIARFDSTNLSAGTVTSWTNLGSDSTIKCILGNGTYASPGGSSNQPTKGSGSSDKSSNGQYGVSFTTSQKIKITYADATKPFCNSTNDYTIFYVAKRDSSASSTERKYILYSNFGQTSACIYGFNHSVAFGSFNKSFYLGQFIENNDQNTSVYAGYNYNAYERVDLENDSNSYVVGASINNKSKSITTFWQNSVFSNSSTLNWSTPQGLFINHASGYESKCTVFEILIFDRNLTNSESLSIRNWLNKKWNITKTTNFSNDSLTLDTSSMVIPMKTICYDGQLSRSKVRGQITDVSSLYAKPFFSLPSRKRTALNNTNYTPWILTNQGFCSFYADTFLKLKDGISDGSYSVFHRDNQFNVSLEVSGQDIYLILTLLNKEGTKKFPIKKLISSKLSDFQQNLPKRITVYSTPRVFAQTSEYNPLWYRKDRHGRNIEDFLALYNPWNNLALYFKDGWPELASSNNFIQSLSIKENQEQNPQIDTCVQNNVKYKSWSYVDGTRDPKNGPSYSVRSIYFDRTSYPTLLNSQIVVMIDLNNEITCDLNIANHDNYIKYLNNESAISQKLTNQYNAYVYDSLPQTEINKINDLTNFYDAGFSTFTNPSRISLTANQNRVVLPFNQLFNTATNLAENFTPFSFIDGSGDFRVFTDEISKGFGGKIQGTCQALTVDTLNINVNDLEGAKNKYIFSDTKLSVKMTYIPQGVMSYKNSTDYWDGEFKIDKQWTNNPAWCFYDLLTNKRYGAGNYVSEDSVDKWSLYKIAKYCDELVPDGFGNLEPRFTSNVYIQSQDEALKVLSDMASIFRGMFYYANGYIYSVNDMPQEVPVYNFTNANVVDGNFNYESTSLKDRNTAIYIRYIDKDNLYKPAVEYVENIEAVRKYGFKETEITAFGCTSRGQAQRLGRWALASEYNETETVAFETGPEATMFRPGDVIKIYDYNKKYKTVGGRLNSINLSGINSSQTTGVLSLDRKLDFDFNNSRQYKFSIISPKYTLDPSISGAISTSLDYEDFRKSLTNSFIINSDNLITGENYDSIKITGLTSVLNTGLNVSGLLPFTGGTGLSSKSIMWTLENSGILDGTTDSDYDFYRIFRVQEANQSNNYTVLAAQMYNLKFTQIESGLTFTPAKAPSDPAYAPDYAVFNISREGERECKTDFVNLDIYYNASIKKSTIGFRIFIYPEYASNFNPNTNLNFNFIPVELTTSYLNTKIQINDKNGEIRIYGVNINNECSSSYVTATYRDNSSITRVDNFKELDYCIINEVNFQNQIQSYNRNDFFPFDLNNRKSNLLFNNTLNFTNTDLYLAKYYPYRIKIIPEKVNSKQEFIIAYNKYVTAGSYIYETEATQDGYLYSHEAISKQRADSNSHRDFSIAIDKYSTYNQTSTSNNFKDPRGFYLITYDNLDSSLKDNLNNLLNQQRSIQGQPIQNSISLVADGSKYILKVSFDLNLSNFVTELYLLLIPINQTFEFGINSINYTEDRIPKSINDKNNKEIVDSHFVRIEYLKDKFNYDSAADTLGKTFNLSSYKAHLISLDIFMGIWNNVNQNQNIFSYISKNLSSSNEEIKTYPIISSPKTISALSDSDANLSLISRIEQAGNNYFHLTLSKVNLIESIFNSEGASAIPNDKTPSYYKLTRRSIIYKPTTDTNPTEKDNNIVSDQYTQFYPKVSIGNRELATAQSASDSNTKNNINEIPSNRRAYGLYGNKILSDSLSLTTSQNASEYPSLLNGIFPETRESNILKCFNNSSSEIPNKYVSSKPVLNDIHITQASNIEGDSPQLLNNSYEDLTDFNILNQSDVQYTFKNDSNTNEDYIEALKDQFNIINITPDENYKDNNGVLENIKHYYSYSIDAQYTYLNSNQANPGAAVLDQNSVSMYCQLNSNNKNYPGIPLINTCKLRLSIFTSPNGEFFTEQQIKNLKFYIYQGSSLIHQGTPSYTKSNVEEGALRGTIIIDIPDNLLKPQNYYTYTDTYTNTTVLANPYLYQFKDAKNLAFAHLSAKKQLGRFPKYNFHIQSFELSALITF